MQQTLPRETARSKRHEKMVPYLFIAPFLISFAVFFVFPAGYSLVLSFFKYKGYGKATFVGLNNYHSLLHYSAFWKAIGNTLFYFLVLGFDVCLDHHADDFAEQLVKACPKGIDIYYENVGS